MFKTTEMEEVWGLGLHRFPSLGPLQMPLRIGKLNKIELKKPVKDLGFFLGFRALGNSISRNS